MSKQGPIILVDDDHDEYEIMKDALQMEGISNETKHFDNGKEALEYLIQTTDRVFLILCDVNMPKMDGIELRKRVNENKELRKKSIPFILYTTSATPEAVSEAYEMSVQGFFEKEHDIASVRQLLRQIVDYWMRCRHPNN